MEVCWNVDADASCQGRHLRLGTAASLRGILAPARRCKFPTMQNTMLIFAACGVCCDSQRRLDIVLQVLSSLGRARDHMGATGSDVQHIA